MNALPGIKAVVFDVYGTLLLGGGPVHPDPEADEALAVFLSTHGLPFTGSITTALADAVKRSHAASAATFPEVDLHALWSEVLQRDIDSPVFIALEDIRQPVALMPHASETLSALSHLPLGLISNAQANTLPVLERLTGLQPFEDDLCILSHRHGEAKPSPALFDSLAAALALRGIAPSETVIVGNDPRHDIVPARARGFRTALTVADRDSLRDGGTDAADAVIADLRQLISLM
ncbi:HAD family hydrolase [Luteolibacter sp. LG18]|uniref:HAD family hydrolase n=1 Tax=Luteolibacter sp. LG18 TaxID=2819286 RepID=UPI0030C6AAF7